LLIIWVQITESSVPLVHLLHHGPLLMLFGCSSKTIETRFF
jgi:hypothetical protein